MYVYFNLSFRNTRRSLLICQEHQQERRCRRAIDVFPNSADLNCIYGDMQYFLRHDSQKAYTHYRIAIESDPEHVPAACGLATVMLELGIERTDAPRDDSAAGREESKTGEISCQESCTLPAFGALTFETVFVTAGLELHGVCETWLAYQKEYAAAMFAYGMWLEMRRGDVSGAEECYRISIEHGRQKKHWVTRLSFGQNCREWFEAKDRVWIQARALNRLAVLFYTVHNKSEAAEAAWDEAHRVDPHYADAFLAHAQMLAGQGSERCTQAEELLRTAIALNKSNVAALFECAKLLHHVKKEPYEAERMYRQCLKEDAHHAGALSQYAILLDKSLKDAGSALTLCKRAVALEPSNTEMLSLYARLLLDVQGDFVGAEKIFQSLLERDLGCVEALHHYGRLLNHVHRDLAGAERMYRRALLVDQNHVPTLTNLGRLLEDMYHDLDGAQVLYLRALNVDPNHPEALLNHGKLLHFGRGDIDGAERLYRRVIEVDPLDRDALHLLGNLLYVNRHNVGEAERMLQKALFVNNSHVSCLCDYGSLLQNAGRNLEAENQFLRALQVDSNSEIAMRR